MLPCLLLVSGEFIWEVKVLQRTFAMSSATVSALRLCFAIADSQSVARQAAQETDDLCSWVAFSKTTEGERAHCYSWRLHLQGGSKGLLWGMLNVPRPHHIRVLHTPKAS